MQCEIDSIAELLESPKIERIYGLEISSGKYENVSVCVVKSGIGKVNAAMCAQVLIDKFDCDAIINTGIAGAISAEISVGDIVISTEAVEHDFNATGIGLSQGEIPQQETSIYKADENLIRIIKNSDITTGQKNKIVYGRVASGDIFVSDSKTKKFISDTFGAKCCEMEGAAIAHICNKCGVPFLIIRAISDSASDDAGELYDSFEEFASATSKTFTLAILSNL